MEGIELKYIVKISLTLLVLLGTFLYAEPAVSKVNKISLSEIEQKFIEKYPVITVQNERNWPPYNYNEDGIPKGFSIDYMNLIADKLGVEIEYIQGFTWSEFMQQLKDEKLDVILNMRRLESRDNIFNFTKPYVKSAKTIFTNLPGISSIDDLFGKIIAVPKNYYMHGFLKKHYPKIDLNVYDNVLDCIVSVVERKSDAVIDDFSVVNYLMKQNGLSLQNVSIVHDRRMTDYLNFATKKSEPMLRDLFQRAIDSVTDEERNRLIDKWFGSGRAIVDKKIDLTFEEKEWIKGNTILVGVSPWKPVGFFNKELNKVDGVSGDILKLVSRRLNLKTKIISADWGTLLDSFKKQEIDLLLSAYYTKQRAKFGLYSKPYLYTKENLFVKNNSNIKNFSDLRGKKLAILKGFGTIEIIKDRFPSVKIIETKSIEESVKLVLGGDVDALFDLQLGVNDYLVNNMVVGLNEIFQTDIDSSAIHYLSNKNKPILQSILQKGLNSVTEDEKKQIVSRWLQKTKESMTNSDNSLSFGEEETKYLKQKKEISMCVDPNWMPYEKIEDGYYMGIGSDYIELFSKKIGINFKLIETKTWEQSKEYIKDGMCDILPVSGYGSARKKYLDITTPYLRESLVLAGRMDAVFISDFASLKGKSVAMSKGHSIIPVLKKEYPEISIIETDSIEDGFAKVLDGDVEGFIDAVSVINYRIQERYWSELKIAGRFRQKYELGVATRADEPILYAVMQKAIDSISPNEHKLIYNKWNVFDRETHSIDYDLLTKILLALLVVLFFYIYREYLHKQSNKLLKSKIDEALIENTRHIQTLQEQSKMVAMGEMVGAIAHQWRQPLNELGLRIQNLKFNYADKDVNEEFINKFIDKNKKTIEFMSNTIDDFSNFFHIEKQKIDFSIKEAIEETISILSALFENNVITVTLEGEDFIIKGFKNEFKQVILNLFSNSMDALIENKVKHPEINIYIQDDKISIKDNAGGISVKVINRVFEPYFTTKEQGKGTGIGLYMSKMIIEDNMNGIISVANSGNGAIFVIDFQTHECSDTKLANS